MYENSKNKPKPHSLHSFCSALEDTNDQIFLQTAAEVSVTFNITIAVKW